MLRRRLWAGILAAVLVLLALPAPAHADTPFRLADQVTDKVGALEGRRGEVDAALAQLRADTGLQMFVVFVKSFDAIPARQWADETAVRSDLGVRNPLLAVATGDRAYAYSVDQNFPLTDAQLSEVAATAIEPALARNDWAGAVIGAADGYRAVLKGQPVPKPAIQPGNPNPGRTSGISVVVIVLLVGLAAAAIGVLVFLRSRRKAAPRPMDPNDPHPGETTQQLNDRANTLLVELDDALRTSERELGMATAEYGPEATASFTAALEAARADIGEAFRVRMELDDVAKDDDAGLRRRLAEIIRRCEAADARLDAESDTFDALRALESKLEQTVPALGSRRAASEAKVAPAEAEVSDLRARFTGPALAAVAGNADQARERLRFATTALDRAGTELGAGRRPAAALAVRAAEQALDQAEELLAAVGKVGTDLRAAADAVPSLLAEVDADLAAGRAAAGSPGTPGPVAANLASAMAANEQAAASTRAALAASTMDPLAELRRLRDADAALDQALGDIRDAAERAARAAATLDQAILAARAEISAAGDFVNTRRGAVGERARTLLAEAQRHLDKAVALAQSDPVTALAEAQQADQIAEQATRAAHSDVDQWSSPRGPGGFAGPAGGGSGLDGLAGAILGGILIGGARGRGYGGGGFGGGFGGGGFGGGGFRGGGGSFGGHSAGGFGGRRGGGGRF